MMDIETIKREVIELRQKAGWSLDERDMVVRFEYLFAELDRRKKLIEQQSHNYIDQHGKIKNMEREIQELKSNPEGIDYETLNKNQAKIIHDQRNELMENEIFFESLKQILDRTKGS